jgi:LysR family transcriptional regulator, hydrogen peroxide-inducible genes activator
MTLQELRYLVALADQGHFTHAAEVCHVGQPTFSTQIRKLEDGLGVVLFDRSQRRVMLTPMGEQIVSRARVALQEIAKIRELATNGQDPMSGILRLGAIPTIGPYLLPSLLSAIHTRYPHLRLLLREDLTAHLLDQLRSGRIDAALMALPLHSEGLEAQPLFTEPFVLALPAGHPLTKKKEVRESDLASHRVLLLEEGHCLRDLALKICGSMRCIESDEVTATSLETLRQMVAIGVGCTLMPVLATAPGFGSIQEGLIEMRPFANPAPRRTIALVWRHRYPREDALVLLVQLIRANLPASVSVIKKTPPKTQVHHGRGPTSRASFSPSVPSLELSAPGDHLDLHPE